MSRFLATRGLWPSWTSPQNGAQYGAPFVEEEWEEDEEDVDALEANEGLIRYENEADVAAAQDVGYEKPLVARLTIQSGNLARPKLRNHPDGALEMLMSLAALPFLSTSAYL
ncbi:hypothetical protein ABZP36_009095 [Zizania latifolia]